MTFAPDNRFTIEEVTLEQPAIPQESESESTNPLMALDVDGLCRAQLAAGTVSYHWTVGSDEIIWSANTEAVLGCNPKKISTGKHFAELLDSENFTSRYDTVMGGTAVDRGAGVPFEIEYSFRPLGRHVEKAIWIEDTGCWFGDESGKVHEVYGTMRLADLRHGRDQHLNFLSNCDALTGMMNRNRMIEALGEAISVAVSENNTCAFAIVAVNNLNIMNEAYGFDVADEVIVTLSQRLRKVMRVGDGIARYSGSRFGVILNGCKPDELNAALERFMRGVRDSVIETSHGPVWALLSIGAISLPAMGDNASAAIARAEEALSEASRMPADGYVVYTSSEQRNARRLLNARCATEIVACLRDNLFKLAFQPIVDATTGEVVMHEALLRMQDTAGQLVTAGHLVPIAERLGLIRLIDRKVLNMALATLEAHTDALLSINVSATTANDPRWNVQLIDVLAAVPELARRLTIEVTESVALADNATAQAFTEHLREIGCGVALDDFGAGYTSFRNLKKLPLTMIKIDGSFCSGFAQSADNQVFVKCMVDLAKAIGAKVVAEWVEDSEDAALFAALGVDYLQGNLFGEPSTVVPWIADENVGQEQVEACVPVVEEVATEVATDSAVDGEVFVAATDSSLDEAVAPEMASTDDAVEPWEAGDVDAHLSLLKAALSELNAAFGPTADEGQRLTG